MSVIATALKHMLAAGLPADAIVAAVAEMEAAMQETVPPTLAKKRERDRIRMRTKRAEESDSRATSRESDDKGDTLSLPPSPQTPQPPTHTHGVVTTRAREADPADDWPDLTGQALMAEIVRTVASPRLDPAKSPGLITTFGRVAAWRRDGASWEFDLIPVLTGLTRKTGPPISTWKFFDAAIAQSVADNRQAMTLPEASHVQSRQDRPQSSRDEALGTMLSGAVVALDRHKAGLG